MDIGEAIAGLNFGLEDIPDPATRGVMTRLLNIIEAQASAMKQLKEENQQLRDEVNRLKGEQGKPNIRKQTRSKDISSEAERGLSNKPSKKRQKKKGQIAVSRVEHCDLDRGKLPIDVVFKGYQSVVVQDIVIRLDNVEFKKAVYYSPSLKKTFIAKTPAGYEGEFGPRIKALILDLLEAGLASSLYQQIDDTGARVKGKNYHTHVLCNAFYTAYFTCPHRDRLTVLEVLNRGQMRFDFNETAYQLMEEMGLSPKRLNALRGYNPVASMNRREVDALLAEMFPNPGNSPSNHLTSQRIILEASAIVGYQQSSSAIDLLLADDAPRFRQVTKRLALCWVHDGRHYKKLEPVLWLHREVLTEFLRRYWDYYRKLLSYKAVPSSGLANSLQKEFDELFATQTGYAQLDDRIEKTRLKKASLLLALQYPELPLHNNMSELGARGQTRYRDISYHTMSKAGTEAKDTFMTLVETAKKLGVNTYHYFYDRLTEGGQTPALSSLIKARAEGFAFNTG